VLGSIYGFGQGAWPFACGNGVDDRGAGALENMAR